MQQPRSGTPAVSESTYNDDVSKLPWPGANPAWCLDWQSYFSAQPNASVMTLRSSGDPYIVEGQVTNCTWSTNAAGVRQTEDAEARVLLTPGVGIVCFSGIILAILVSRYNKAEDRAATNLKYGLGTEATPLATRKQEEEQPYGATVRTAALLLCGTERAARGHKSFAASLPETTATRLRPHHFPLSWPQEGPKSAPQGNFKRVLSTAD